MHHTAKMCDFGLTVSSYRPTTRHLLVNVGDYYMYSRMPTKPINVFMFAIRLLQCSTSNMAINKIVSVCANKMEVEIFNMHMIERFHVAAQDSSAALWINADCPLTTT